MDRPHTRKLIVGLTFMCSITNHSEEHKEYFLSQDGCRCGGGGKTLCATFRAYIQQSWIQFANKVINEQK